MEPWDQKMVHLIHQEPKPPWRIGQGGLWSSPSLPGDLAQAQYLAQFASLEIDDDGPVNIKHR